MKKEGRTPILPLEAAMDLRDDANISTTIGGKNTVLLRTSDVDSHSATHIRDLIEKTWHKMFPQIAAFVQQQFKTMPDQVIRPAIAQVMNAWVADWIVRHEARLIEEVEKVCEQMFGDIVEKEARARLDRALEKVFREMKGGS